jgi:non-homologous end joining protein Ku
MEIKDETVKECFYQTIKDIFAENAELDQCFYDRIYCYLNPDNMEDEDYDLLFEKMYALKEKILTKILDK